MSIRTRILMMGLLALVGILSILTLLIGQELRGIANRNAVLADTGLAEQISELVHQLQKERGLSAGFLGGDKAISARLADQHKQSDQKLDALGNSTFSANGRLKELGATRTAISTLGMSVGQSFDYYSVTILALLQDIGTIAERTYSPEIQDQLFAHAHFLHAKEYLGQMRASLMEALALHQIDSPMVARLGHLQGLLAFHRQEAMRRSSPQMAEVISISFDDQRVRAALAIVDAATRTPSTVLTQTTTEQWFVMATNAIDRLKAIEGTTLGIAKVQAQAEVTAAKWSIAKISVSTAAFALALLWLSISSTRRILRAMDVLLGGVERVVETHDFGHRIPFYSHDELSRISHSFNELLDIAERLIDEKETLASNDPLTGAFNRYKFRELFERSLSNEKRYRGGMALVFLDVDHFKQVNDRFGHGAGDMVLVQLTKLIQEQSRNTDVVARWGGEEFVILVPQGGEQAAEILAENIRKVVAAYDFPGVGRVTVSLGISTYVEGDSLESICQRADYALYHAKQEGRNRVCVRLATDLSADLSVSVDKAS